MRRGRHCHKVCSLFGTVSALHLHVAELKKKSSNVAYALQVKPALVLAIQVTIQNKNTATPSLNKVHKSIENRICVLLVASCCKE